MQRKNNVSCRLLNLRQVARFLKKHDNYVILTHASPDGDTLGSAYALYYGLKEIGKTAEVLCPEIIPAKYDYFARETDHIVGKPTVVAVDVAAESLLGSLKDEFGDKVDLTIDHHISNTMYAHNLYLDSAAAATCEIIYELLVAMRVNINDVTAKALYTGMVTDTGCFKYSCVTAKTHIIAANLYDFELDAASINKLMFDTKPRKLVELEKMVLEGAEYHFDGRCMLLSVSAEMQEKTGCSGTELEGIAVLSRSVEGVIAGITLKQTGEKEFKASLRTYPPLNASEICKKLGGGGHNAAAGVTLYGTLEEVKAQILDGVKAALEETDERSATDK